MEEREITKEEALKIMREDIEKAKNDESIKYQNEFWKELGEIVYDKCHRLLDEKSFNTVVDELLQNENYSIEFLKKDYFWGLFDSGCTGALPQEFFELFEKSYHGDNKELLYKLNYLDCCFSSIFRADKEYTMNLVNECIELAKKDN